MTESHVPQPAPQVAQPPQLVSEFYEFMLWCMDRTQRFPRSYRGTLTRWIEDHRQCLSLSQYEYAARAINTLGVGLGGWIKQQRAQSAP
jgi:hypothetical protein